MVPVMCLVGLVATGRRIVEAWFLLIGIGAARHCAGVDGRCGPCLDVPRTCLEFDFVPVLRDGSLMIRTAGIDEYLCFVALCLAQVLEVFFKRGRFCR